MMRWNQPREQLAWYPSQTLLTHRTLHLMSALTQPIVADRPSVLRSNHVWSGITSGSAHPTTVSIRNQHQRYRWRCLNALWRTIVLVAQSQQASYVYWPYISRMGDKAFDVGHGYCSASQKIPPAVFWHFYRVMHFSAKRGIAIACRLSVCLPVSL